MIPISPIDPPTQASAKEILAAQPRLRGQAPQEGFFEQ